MGAVDRASGITRVLKRKQTADNGTYAWAWDHIEELVTSAAAKLAVVEACVEMEEFVQGKDCAYGWSGGKDSQALRLLCELVGIERVYALVPLLISRISNILDGTGRYQPAKGLWAHCDFTMEDVLGESTRFD